MKLNDLLKYLTEASISSPDAPEGSPLGQYLFAPERKDTPKPKEINTDLENEIQQALSDHYSGGGEAEKTEAGVMALFDMKERGLYSKFLEPPSGLAYRFMKCISPEKVSGVFLTGLTVEELTANPGKAIYVPDVGIVSKPNASSSIPRGGEHLSSWTIEPDLSAFSSFLHTVRDLISIVLVADIQSNDFVMNPAELSKALSYDTIMPVELIGREREVIAKGPVNVIGAAYYYADPNGPSMISGGKVHDALLKALRAGR